MSAWDLIKKEMNQIIDTIKEKKQRVIQKDEINDINSWLKRVEWHTYLMRLNREELIASMNKLNFKTELIVIIIWNAMNSLIQHCQQSMIFQIDVFICMKIIHIKKHQTRYQSLQSYMNVKELSNYSRSWKQILIFMIQIKRVHDWVSFKYKFNKMQHHMWKQLLIVANEMIKEKKKKNVKNEEKDEFSKNSSSSEFSEKSDSSSQDSWNYKLSRIQKACLNFDLTLLNDHIMHKKYDSSLMCALTMLRIKNNEWMNVSNYSFILFVMIKISRFMMIQQELKMNDSNRLDSQDSHSSSFSIEEIRIVQSECLKYIMKMMNQFMIQDSYSFM